MNSAPLCSRCGKQLPDDAPRKLCPGCLLLNGLADGPFHDAKGGLSAAPENAPPAIPDYELLRPIGRGAYGEVWLARNVMGTYRAVKIVHRERFPEDRPYEREFDGIRKFEATSGTHPGLLNVLHVGRNDAGGYFYYVMELADGEDAAPTFDPGTYRARNLRGEIDRRGPLPFEECVRIGLSLSEALEHLHQRGLLHRDIKPANIIFVKGVPKLADIGLVTEIGKESTLVFTPGYNAPEGPGGPAADVYGLGKVLYVMSTGRKAADFPSLPTTVSSGDDERDVHRFKEIMLRACDADPSNRYGSAQELHEALLALKNGVAADSVTQISPTATRTGLRRWWVPASALAVLLVIGLPLLNPGNLWRRPGSSIPSNLAALPAGQVLSVAYAGQPPAAPANVAAPRLQLSLVARRQGAAGFVPLNDGDALASEVDDYVIVARPLSPGFLYLFQVDSSGKVDWLHPKNPGSPYSSGANPVTPGQPIQVPPADSQHVLHLDRTTGIEHVYAVFTAAQWPELERELGQPATLAAVERPVAIAQVVQAPNELRTRGVGGTRKDPAAAAVNDVVERLYQGQRVKLPFPELVVESSGHLLVIERWFRHVNPP